MNKRSIGIVCTSPGFGGLELNNLKLAHWLQQQGWKVRLLINADSAMDKQAAGYCRDVTRIQEIGKNAKTSSRAIRKWLTAQEMSILFTAYNKDIKALSNYKRFYNRKIKLVYQQQMQVGVSKRDLIHRLRYQMLDLWISPLPYLKQETIQKTHVPPEKIEVIPLGVPIEPFLESKLTRQEARGQLEIPQDAVLLGVLGRIDPKKGQDFAIRAVAHLRDHYHKTYHLLVMGNITRNEGDAYLSLLYDLVQQHRLEEQVFFRPYNNDVHLFYKAIDVFVMPSHGETYGMVTLEAMLSGRPVVGVNRDGTSAILQNGKFGWLHELDDMEGFCGQLFRSEIPEEKEIVLKAAKEEVLSHYSMDLMIRETDRALSRLL